MANKPEPNTRPLPQPSELVDLVGCISKTAWLLRLNLEDGDKRMAIENSNTMLSLIERGTAPDDLHSARTLHAEIAACITRQEGLGGDSLVCSLGSYLATCITQLKAQIAKLQARLEVVPGWSEDADGIACRNDTIKLQDECIAKLQADGERLAEALEAFQRHYDLNDCDERCGALEVPISDLRRACQALTEWKDRA